MKRPLAAVRRRRLLVSAGAAFALLAALAGATPGAFGAYSAKITNSTDTAASATYFKCVDALAADKDIALFQWPLTDAAGSTNVTDVSGKGNVGTYQGTVATSSSAVACPRDAGTSWDLDGTTSYAYLATSQSNPQVFSEEIWFRTSVAGGKLIGFGNAQTGVSSKYDRHLFLTTTGAVSFGIYNSGTKLATSPAGYADGRWHQAVGTLSSAGMVLYVDGRIAATNAARTAEDNTGYWRVGYDAISTSWANPQPPRYFQGQLRYAAVYTTALTQAQVTAHYAAGSGS